MSYADFRLTAAGRLRRETARMQAAGPFEQRIKPSEVAQRLRVSRKSAHQWHQSWRDGGVRALASRGPSESRCRFSSRCPEKLAAYPEQEFAVRPVGFAGRLECSGLWSGQGRLHGGRP
ncbi:helix-turn-helix domain-containing protein [Streptomyces sp. NPDC048295]|uniref:helix-turn-helix domain-containing protein n=1 Tax=Streptomyces sp. NPDC048295 TaxID=3154617 RepID=UPI00342BCA86